MMYERIMIMTKIITIFITSKYLLGITLIFFSLYLYVILYVNEVRVRVLCWSFG